MWNKEISKETSKTTNWNILSNSDSETDDVIPSGKLILLFASTLFAFNHSIETIKAIDDFGFMIKVNKLTLANFHKLFSIATLSQNLIKKAIKHINICNLPIIINPYIELYGILSMGKVS
jgi:hypothetical protein